MKNKISDQELQRLATATTYQEFLTIYFEVMRSKTSSFNYASVSKAAGFSSRAFVREVVLGKKRITAKALTPLAEALRLKGPLKDFFLCLVAQSETDVHSLLKPSKNRIEKLREKLKGQSYQFVSEDTDIASRVFKLTGVAQVFAALGTKEDGAPIREILSRVQLPEVEVRKTLSALNEMGMITETDGRFRAATEHVHFQQLGSSAVFKNMFLEQIDRVKTQALSDFNSDTDLFFTSSFSLNVSSLIKLKSELRVFLQNFTEENEVSNGDTVITLVASLVR